MTAFIPTATWPPCALPPEFDHSTGTQFRKIFDNPDRPILFLVEAWPYSSALPKLNAGGPPPACVIPPCTLPYFRTWDGVTPVRLATQEWRTRPDDPQLPNAAFRSRIAQRGFSLSAELFSGLDPASGGGTRGSEIEVLFDTSDPAASGERARWARMAWDGRQLTVLAGLPEFDYRDFGVAAQWTIAGVSFEEGRATLLPRDRAEIFERAIQQTLYAGTGDAEGHAGLAGAPKPLAFGRPFNVSPVLLDQVDWIYQLHDGPIDAVTAVRDKGVPLVFSADYASFGDLQAASIAGGAYATCLAGGYLRLGAEPAGGITCDLRGDATGGYVESCGGLIWRIVTTRLGARSLPDPAGIDGRAFGELDVEWPAAAGIYITGERTVADVLRDIERSFFGRLFFTRAGLLSVCRIARPTITQSTITTDILGEPGVTRDASPPPPWRIRVGFGRNWTVQARNDLAGAAEAEPGAIELYGNEYRFATAEAPAVRNRHRLSSPLDWPTVLAEEADAAALAAHILSFSTRPWHRYRVPLRSSQLRYWIGDRVTLDLPAADLPAGGLKGMVAGLVEDNGTGNVDLEVVG